MKVLAVFFVVILLMFSASSDISQEEDGNGGVYHSAEEFLRAMLELTIPLRMAKGNLFDGVLKPPSELAFFLFKDGDFFVVTNDLENSIFIPDTENFFRKQGKEIKDLILVYHNHNIPSRFSKIDIRFYRYLKKRGFKGIFGIYYPFNKTVKILNDR